MGLSPKHTYSRINTMAKLYWFPVSPFARFVYHFALESKTEVETVVVDLLKGEHKTDQYVKEVNENHKVPALVDGDLRVWESQSIVRYLARKNTDQTVYPQKDIKEAALHDRTLETLDR